MSSTPKPKLPSAQLSPPGGSSRPPARRVDPPSAWPAAADSALDGEAWGISSGVGRKGRLLDAAVDSTPLPRSNQRWRDGSSVARFAAQEWRAVEDSDSRGPQPTRPRRRSAECETERPHSDAAMGLMRLPKAADALPPSHRSFQHTSMELRSPVGLPATELIEASAQPRQSLPELVLRYGDPSTEDAGAGRGGLDRMASYGVYQVPQARSGHETPEETPAGVLPPSWRSTLPGTREAASLREMPAPYGAGVSRASGGYAAVAGATPRGAPITRAPGRAANPASRASGAHSPAFGYGGGRGSGGFAAAGGSFGPGHSPVLTGYGAPVGDTAVGVGAPVSGERISLEMAASAGPYSARSSRTSHEVLPFPPPGSRPVVAPSGSGITRWQLAALAASFAFSLLLVLLAIERPQAARTDAPPASQSASAPAVPQADSASGQCGIRQVPERLASNVDRGVPLEIMVQGKRRVLGFADARGTAIGMVWTPGDARPRAAYREHPRADVRAVMPASSALLDDFYVDTAESSEVLRSFGGQQRWQLVSRDGDLLARRPDGSGEQLLGSSLAELGAMRPQVLELDSKRYALALREDGQTGRVWVGTFHEDGESPALLRAIPFEVPTLGAPALAVHAKRLLLAVAARQDGSPNGLLLAALEDAADGVRLLHQTQWTPPAGARWSEPRLTALPDATWLLQWTEQRAGGSEVRVRRLDSELKPLGAQLLVSPRGANAVAASVAGSNVPSVFYFVTNGGTDELWVQALQCD